MSGTADSHSDTAILLLNLGGPVTLAHVEPCLYALDEDYLEAVAAPIREAIARPTCDWH